MRVRRKFLQLTQFTNPHGHEKGLKSFLPTGTKEDIWGNLYLQIGDNPTTMFTCHLDTADSRKTKVNHVIYGDIIKTDGKSILGADDKAGMVVILSMIEKQVPGLYYFFIGEEVGCIGSSAVATGWKLSDFSKTIKKVVSFDRRGYNSIITHQMFSRSCSSKFAEELSNRLNSCNYGFKFRPDNTGIFTDSASFVDLVPECTNISVGYTAEHTISESQDIGFLIKLCKAVCEIDWETLPIERDPMYDDYDIIDYGIHGNRSYNEDGENVFSEEFYSFFCIGNKTKKMYISHDIIRSESNLLYNWLSINGYSDIVDMLWNGNRCYVQCTIGGTYTLIGNRIELMDLIPELGLIPRNKLSENVTSREIYPGLGEISLLN